MCIFVTLFAYLDDNLLSPTILFALVMFLGIVGYALFDLIDDGKERQESGRSSKSIASLVAGQTFFYDFQSFLISKILKK